MNNEDGKRRRRKENSSLHYNVEGINDIENHILNNQ